MAKLHGDKLGEAFRFARTLRPHHAQTFARTVVPEVIRPARVIWNQVIAAVFFILAITGASRGYQFFREGQTGQLAIAAVFTAVMATFGFTSWRRARRVQARPRRT